MKIEKTNIDGLIIIEPDVFYDHRGWFYEVYSKSKYEEIGIMCRFIQGNRSYTIHKNTIRGLHLQAGKYAQAKLIQCIKGSVMDVAVDLRESSPTFGKWVSMELSEENKKQVYIPKGFAHGFLTLENDCDVLYNVDEHYNRDSERTILYNDMDLDVNWGSEDFILSDKDKKGISLKEFMKEKGM